MNRKVRQKSKRRHEVQGKFEILKPIYSSDLEILLQ